MSKEPDRGKAQGREAILPSIGRRQDCRGADGTSREGARRASSATGRGDDAGPVSERRGARVT